jgi:hypothetical protein
MRILRKHTRAPRFVEVDLDRFLLAFKDTIRQCAEPIASTYSRCLAIFVGLKPAPPHGRHCRSAVMKIKRPMAMTATAPPSVALVDRCLSLRCWFRVVPTCSIRDRDRSGWAAPRSRISYRLIYRNSAWARASPRREAIISCSSHFVTSANEFEIKASGLPSLRTPGIFFPPIHPAEPHPTVFTLRAKSGLRRTHRGRSEAGLLTPACCQNEGHTPVRILCCATAALVAGRHLRYAFSKGRVVTVPRHEGDTSRTERCVR